jgi:hypothetical protein
MARFAVAPGWMLRVRLSEVDDVAGAVFKGNEVLRAEFGEVKEFSVPVSPGDVLEINAHNTKPPRWNLRYEMWLGREITGSPTLDVNTWGVTPHFGLQFTRRIEFTA